ncbi:polymer-forming cytoskeletal protein [Shewanella sp. NIFS-20-20]|uniref:bactofilin family protein n=1 Tax=Shewanella sp. NIFS-20-20 TaxID=2853806 RepID=UPI001C43F25E|nr:polymer-forming cytoskeletal protein [Shewanella sp. NIFS-20-20]MBV7314854.1 polymer-forming cytoskeletal protein [Shewanella sp. NIFS-20-20]
MFKRKNTTLELTYIAKGTCISGETEFAGDALIGGDVKGQVISQGQITIEHEGTIQGQVQCHEMRIAGHFSGKLSCEKVIIMGTGTLDGEVASNQMEILEGGQFIGMRIKESINLLENTSLFDDEKLKKLQTLSEA